MSYFSPNSLSNVNVSNDGSFLGQTGWFNCGLTGPIKIASGEKVIVDGGSLAISNNELAVTNSNIDLLAGTVSGISNINVDVKNSLLPVSNVYLSNLSNLDAKQSDLLSNVITTNTYLQTMTYAISDNKYQCNITNGSIAVTNSNIDLLAGTVLNGNVKVDIRNSELAVINSNIDLLAGTVLNGNVKVDIQDASIAVTQSGTWSTRMQDGSGNLINSTTNALNVYNTNNITGYSTSANQTAEIGYLSNIQNYTSNLNNSIFTTATFPSSQVAVATSRDMILQYGCFKFIQSAAVSANLYSTFIDTSNVINSSNTCIYPSGSRVQVDGANVIVVSAPDASGISYIPKGAAVTIGLRGMDAGSSTNYILCPAAVDTAIASGNGYVIGAPSSVTSAFSNSHCAQWYFPDGVPRYIGFYNATSSAISNVKVIISFRY